MNEDNIKIEDAIAVLSEEPTINQRLDKLEKMMEQILLRLPYNNNSQPIWITQPTNPWTPDSSKSPNTFYYTATTDSK